MSNIKESLIDEMNNERINIVLMDKKLNQILTTLDEMKAIIDKHGLKLYHINKQTEEIKTKMNDTFRDD